MAETDSGSSTPKLKGNKSSSNSNFSFVVNKFGEAGVHTLGNTGSATKIECEDFNLREYGMIATNITIRESTDTSVHSTCGDNIYMYTTGPGAVSLTIEGEIVYTKDPPTNKRNRDSREVRRRKRQQPSSQASTKDPSEFWNEYRAGKHGATKIVVNDKGTYYVVLIGWEITRSSTPNEKGTFSLTFMGTSC